MYILVFIGLLILSYFISLYFPVEKSSIFKDFVEMNNFFCVQYLLFSTFFIVWEQFAVWKVLLCIGIFDIFALCGLIIKL